MKWNQKIQIYLQNWCFSNLVGCGYSALAYLTHFRTYDDLNNQHDVSKLTIRENTSIRMTNDEISLAMFQISAKKTITHRI